MGSDDQPALVGELVEKFSESQRGGAVEAVEWLIEQQHMRLLGHGAGEEGALLLSSREFADLTALQIR